MICVPTIGPSVLALLPMSIAPFENSAPWKLAKDDARRDELAGA